MAKTTRVEIRNERTRKVIENVNAEIQRWTMERLDELQTTHHTRRAAERAHEKVICGRKWLIVPKHTDEEKFFLRLILLHTLALKPALQSKAYEVADYFSSNYPYEWTQSRVARLAIARSRDMILSSAESEFGETPMAAPLAFVYHHNETVGIRNPSNYGECYATAAGLVRQRYFTNQDQPWRERLGLHLLHST